MYFCFFGYVCPIAFVNYFVKICCIFFLNFQKQKGDDFSFSTLHILCVLVPRSAFLSTVLLNSSCNMVLKQGVDIR